MLRSKRLLSVIMTVAMAVTTFVGLGITASATTYWDGVVPSANSSATFSGGAGTASNPYLISTPTDLAQLSANVAAGYYQASGSTRYYFEQTADIYLNSICVTSSNVNPSTAGVAGYTGSGTVYEWQPIGGGNTSYSFQGVYDGGGYTVYNIFYNHSDGTYTTGNSLKNNIGLFGKLEETPDNSNTLYANVKNLSISGGYIGAQRSVGGIAGKSWGRIENCHNLGVYVYSTDAKGVGGIVGANWVNTTTNPPEVNKCTNAGTVVSTYYSEKIKNGVTVITGGSAGGIAGENEGQVYNCCNCGTITSNYNAGGIVGSNKNDYNKQTQTGGTIYGGISNCYNKGTVSGLYAGGIVGYELGSMRNVYNIGTISGTNAGQLIGELASSSARTHTNLFHLSGTTAVGVTDSGAGAITTTTFTSTTSGKDGLLTALNNWVTNAGTTIYSSWTRSSSVNNGYPVFA